MDNLYLRTFLEIVRAGNFSEAARSLKLSQPAVSFQIQKLEQDLGAKLLERGSGKLAITPAGLVFKEHAESIIAEEDTMIEELSALRSEVIGRLSIAASTVPGEFILPYVITDFRNEYPNVNIDIEVSDTNGVVKMVNDGPYDLGFTGAKVEVANMVQTKFYKDRMVLIVPNHHPFSTRSWITVEELQEQQMIWREGGSGTMSNIQKILQKAGVDPSTWKNLSSLGSTQSVISGVQAGLGISFVSDFAVKPLVDAGLLKSIPINKINLERDLFIVHKKNGLTTKLQQTFFKFAKSWKQE
ncbi:MAG: selenium metabolism-associated LysR family transcriptional regulator [Dehalococcoidia bacterium]